MRKYCFSRIPVIKGVYKPLTFTGYLVIVLFLSKAEDKSEHII